MKRFFFLLLPFFFVNSYCEGWPFLIYYGSKMSQKELEQWQERVLDPLQYKDVASFSGVSYAYVSVGEIENFRSWHQKLSEKKLLGEQNPHWPESRYVSLRDNFWETLLIQEILPGFVKQGYQGFFLDTIDSLLLHHKKEECISFLNALKKAFPDQLFMINRGLEIANLTKVDSVLLESTITSHDFQTKKYFLLDPQPTIQIQKKIYSLDYWDPKDPHTIFSIYEKATKKGYIPLVSTIDLQNPPTFIMTKNGQMIRTATKTIFSKILPRKIAAFYDDQDSEVLHSTIHNKLEVILNYYGYFCDFIPLSQKKIPDISEYGGAVIWLATNPKADWLQLVEWLHRLNQNGYKFIWAGNIPTPENLENALSMREKMKNYFGFSPGDEFRKSPLGLKFDINTQGFDFEASLKSADLTWFQQYLNTDKTRNQTLLSASVSDQLTSDLMILGDFGLFAESQILFHEDEDPYKRWIFNPFKLIETVFNTTLPIPDPTSLDSKRISFIHLDADGGTSVSEVSPPKIAMEIIYERIFKKYPFKTGVGFIGYEVDPKFKGNEKTVTLIKKILQLDHLEIATHTNSHPFHWKDGIVPYVIHGEAEATPWGKITAYKLNHGNLDLKFEVLDSLSWLQTLLPENRQPQKILYYSGNCMPTESQIRWLREHDVLAINGGDSFYDRYFNSIAYLTPLGRDVGEEQQIYSPNANENTYTHNWSGPYWGFRRVIETFEKTGFPRRIKPVNLYYHFYSGEKIASLNALKAAYEWIKKNDSDLVHLFPSQWIQIAKNFYTVKIHHMGKNHYKIENATHLKDFRFPGKISLSFSDNVKSVHYNEKLDVSWIHIGDKKEAEWILH